MPHRYAAVLIFVLLWSFPAASHAQTSRAQAPLPQPKNLLPTEKLANWRAVWHPQFRRSKLTDHYRLKDGVLHVTGGTNGAIVSLNEYQDFELHFQWRWVPGGKAGNGGVMVHTQPSRGPLFVTGIEIQLRDGEAGDLYGVGIGARGLDRRAQQGNRILRRAAAEGEKIESPAGQWNQAVVTCIGDRIRVRINGKLVNEAARLGRSQGRIAIQAEDEDIQFQNVTLTPLTQAVVQSEAVDLFNGQDLSGWTMDHQDASAKAQDEWTVKDGTLRWTGSEPSVLRTQTPYENYRLSLQWRWPADQTVDRVEAGVLLHCTTPRERSVWPKSIKTQLAPSHAGDLWTIGVGATIADTDPPSRIPTKRQRVNLTNDSERAPGQWNQLLVYAIGDTLRVFVNGDLVNEAWELSGRKGAIGLQAAPAIEYRQIQLQPMLVE